MTKKQRIVYVLSGMHSAPNTPDSQNAIALRESMPLTLLAEKIISHTGCTSFFSDGYTQSVADRENAVIFRASQQASSDGLISVLEDHRDRTYRPKGRLFGLDIHQNNLTLAKARQSGTPIRYRPTEDFGRVISIITKPSGFVPRLLSRGLSRFGEGREKSAINSGLKIEDFSRALKKVLDPKFYQVLEGASTEEEQERAIWQLMVSTTGHTEPLVRKIGKAVRHRIYDARDQAILENLDRYGEEVNILRVGGKHELKGLPNNPRFIVYTALVRNTPTGPIIYGRLPNFYDASFARPLAQTGQLGSQVDFEYEIPKEPTFFDWLRNKLRSLG